MRSSGPARFFVPVGIVLIIFGVIMLGMNPDNYAQTTGKITEVTESVFEEDQQQYDVSFTYKVAGKVYEATFGNLSGTFNIGDNITVYYDTKAPERTTNSKPNRFHALILVAAGVAVAGFGVFRTVRTLKKNKALDQSAGAFPTAAFADFKMAPGVTEYYFRYDGHMLKPGYLLEDADRNVLFEGKMEKNALVGARIFNFENHVNGSVQTHEVGHTVTQSYNDALFSASSGFKFDGKNIWDVLHEKGIRLATDLHSKFPNLVYHVAKDGAPFARIETSSIYVHEDDAAQHKRTIPVGKMYYRCWTVSDDFETIFLTMFAITETEQTVVE